MSVSRPRNRKQDCRWHVSCYFTCMKMNLALKFSLPVILALAVALVAGCVSTPPVDWNSRVGNFTYPQAVAELGRPDRQLQQSDGKMVYKWFVQPHVPPPNTGMSYHGETTFGANQNAGVLSNQMIQLTFGPDGKLSAWTRNY